MLDGAVWSDCGIAEGLDVLDGLVDWSLLLVLGAAEDGAVADGVWLVAGVWSELCG